MTYILEPFHDVEVEGEVNNQQHTYPISGYKK